ncbi:hypothetical protein QTQ03_25300 [Micromonospora sp. WMMA1363]|uniref:hypothetical protein n=1 Tax=Micromonospora sp. WMMA1363 TaxID=3053985 RepID=UPI00259CCC2E|nr:hypothetical protein [Micromonospora sp. WMMA1363]MDM4722752.1 hypothetical protein [Micromonospora sp. WMMA1363]
MPITKRATAEIKADTSATVRAVEDARRETAVMSAVAGAYEAWRNRPGRARPKLVREALADAARRAYDAARSDD